MIGGGCKVSDEQGQEQGKVGSKMETWMECTFKESDSSGTTHAIDIELRSIIHSSDRLLGLCIWSDSFLVERPGQTTDRRFV